MAFRHERRTRGGTGAAGSGRASRAVGRSGSSGLATDTLPQDARGAEHQYPHEHEEHDHDLPLGCSARDAVAFNEAQDQAPGHSPADVPDPPEHGGRERLDAGLESDEESGRPEEHDIEEPGGAGEHTSEEE